MAFCELNRVEDCFPEIVDTSVICPICGGDKEQTDIVCDDCREEAIQDFIKFLRGYDPEALTLIDSLLDGVSLADFIKTYGGTN